MVTAEHLADKNAVYDIAIAYPRTGDRRIDADLFATVNHIAQSFRKEANAAHDPQEPPYTLDVSYRVARNDGQMFGVEFDDEWDFRGAHPNLEIVTANYFRADGWRVYLPELFDGSRGLARISALATADLDRQLLSGDPSSDKDWIARGADAHWGNFAAFLLLRDALEIEFPPYAVAAYADGPQRVRLPLTRLRDVTRDNPRTPVPSFDCTRAATRDERLICSDAILARLDREVGETYANEIRNENDPERKTQLIHDARVWLSQRENSCRDARAPIACLMALYQARLAALDE